MVHPGIVQRWHARLRGDAPLYQMERNQVTAHPNSPRESHHTNNAPHHGVWWGESPEGVPRKGSSGPSGEPLRERLENSNFVLIKIPVEIHNLDHGQQLTSMGSERLPEELGLDEQDIDSLSQAGLVRRRPQKPRPKEWIDYEALQQTYARMLTDGGFANQADLARHLGVSRVWLSRVLKSPIIFLS